MDALSPPKTSSIATAESTPNSPARSRYKKWHGHQRTASLWDGLRKDADLWYDEGDCLVYLYADPSVERGPSFRLPWTLLKNAQCMPLLQHSMSPPSKRDRDELPTGMVELHLAAPKALCRGDLLRHHITTRNFFAWICSKPLVGHSLGQALSDLFDRMATYRSQNVDNVEDLLVYADDMGYSHIDCCPDHALAMLYFAENNRLAYVWTDAFAHCVGMNDELSTSPEFDQVCQVTKALITRAYLEMDLHITRATRALSDFLQDDLSDAYLGLSVPARAHLETFRTFLLSYHIDRYGYWPPTTDNNFPKHVFWSMYTDFHSLYTFMADPRSSHSQSTSPATGGVCVFQNIEAFNARHKFPNLAHPQPNLPRIAVGASNSARDSLRRFAMSRSQRSSTDVSQIVEEPPVKVDRKILTCPLVQRYRQFDANSDNLLRDRINPVEACKVRWIMVYCTLQTVRSIVASAKEVRASEAPYPLCVLTAGLPTWRNAAQTRSSAPAKLNGDGDDEEIATDATPPLDIRPDCETSDFIKPLHTYANARPKSRSTLSRSQSTKDLLSRIPSSINKSVRRASMSARSHKRKSSTGSENTVIDNPVDTSVEEPSLSPDEEIMARLAASASAPVTPLEEKPAEALPNDMLDVDMLLPPPSPERAGYNDYDRDEDPEPFHEPLMELGQADHESQTYVTEPERPSSAQLRQELPKLRTGIVMAVQPASERSPTLDDSSLFPRDEFEAAGFSGTDDSVEEPPSLNWSSESHSPNMRHSEDNMSIPSLEPGMPPASPTTAMQARRTSSGFLSSLRSSRATSMWSKPSERSSRSTVSHVASLRSSMKAGAKLSPDWNSRFDRMYVSGHYGASTPPIYEEP